MEAPVASSAEPGTGAGPVREGRLVPELDGVRGLAILLVLGFHFGQRPEGVPRLLTAPFALGWSGVDLFFVLSGFLITGVLLDARGAPNYFSAFYARRVLRIFPLYLGTLAACFLVYLPLARGMGHPVPEDRSLQIWYWLHISNWQSAFGREFGLLTHYWSLAIEEQFYLVWPLLVWRVPDRWFPQVCLGIMGAALGLRLGFFGYAETHPYFLTRLTPFRLDTLAMGGLLAAVVRNAGWTAWLRRKVLPFSLLSSGLVVTVLAAAKTHQTAHPLVATLGFSAFAMLYGILVFTAHAARGGTEFIPSLLRWPWLRSFGKYSYAIYVFHFPLSIWLSDMLLRLAPAVPRSLHILLWIAYKAGGAGLSWLLGWLSWRLLEQHFLKLKSRFEAQRAPGFKASSASAPEH